MELFARLFGGLLLFVYHCFDRLVIHGYLSGLSRPEQVVYFFRQVCRRAGDQQRGSVTTHQRLPELCRGLRPQPGHPDRMG